MRMYNDPVVKMCRNIIDIIHHLLGRILRLSQVQGAKAAFKHFGNQGLFVRNIRGGGYNN